MMSLNWLPLFKIKFVSELALKTLYTSAITVMRNWS